MGLIGSILSMVFNVVSNDVAHKADDFYSGYDRGSSRASHMSDAELQSSLRRAKENGVSGWSDAGKVRAMADEYKNRK